VICPSSWKIIIAQWHGVVNFVGFWSRTDLRFLVIKSTKMLPGAILCAAWVRPVVLRVVEQLLCPVCVWASNTERASLLIRKPGVLLAPEGTWLHTIPN